MHYQSQRQCPSYNSKRGCDLLRIYYFCTINHSYQQKHNTSKEVVICFEFIIFALSITAQLVILFILDLLWFASNLLFLHYQSQQRHMVPATIKCCDLLRIYYFCTINHSWQHQEAQHHQVVICFEFIIFALSITAIKDYFYDTIQLWFASNLLFLHYQSQPSSAKLASTACCDLLRIYYFCTINHSADNRRGHQRRVVICFEFIIFALSITACDRLK